MKHRLKVARVIEFVFRDLAELIYFSCKVYLNVSLNVSFILN